MTEHEYQPGHVHGPQFYCFSTNPSDGVDQVKEPFTDYVYEWGVWRSIYDDHGGEG